MAEPLQIVPDSGFDFGNVRRNLILAETGLSGPKAVSTGTTIVGALFKGGVVIGADSRATADNIIADKACNKLHKLTDFMYCAGAGTAADLDQVSRMISSQLKLMELNTGRRAAVVSGLRHAKQYLHRYMGYVGAYLLIAGVDDQGSELFEVAAHGSTVQAPYAADGSGSLNAMAVLEHGFKKDMTEAECIALVSAGLEAGMHGDLASGNSYRYVVIDKDSSRVVENLKPAFTKSAEKGVIKFPAKATKVLSEKEKPFLRAKVQSKKFDTVQEMEIS